VGVCTLEGSSYGFESTKESFVASVTKRKDVVLEGNRYNLRSRKEILSDASEEVDGGFGTIGNY
jgi:hypothetical protein